MKKFHEFLSEEMLPYAQTEKGFVGVDNGPVRDNINIHLTAITAKPYATPYHAMEMVRKVLAPFSIFPPSVNFLDGESGHEIFEISQFGNKMGMTNNGEVVNKMASPYYVYFEYAMNDTGAFDIFCEIVTEDELEEIIADVEDEMDGEDTTTGDMADAEDSYDAYKAKNQVNEEKKDDLPFDNPTEKPSTPYKNPKSKAKQLARMAMKKAMTSDKAFSKLSKKDQTEVNRRLRMSEENLNELHGKSKEAMKAIKKRLEKKHDDEWEATQAKRKELKSAGPADTKGEDKKRNDLAKRWLRADKAEKKLNESKEAKKHHRAAQQVGPKHPDYNKHMAAFHTAMADYSSKPWGQTGKPLDGGKLADQHRAAAAHYAKNMQDMKEDYDSVSKQNAEDAKAISKSFRKKDKPEAKAWRQATKKLYNKAVTGLPQKKVKGLGGLDESEEHKKMSYDDFIKSRVDPETGTNDQLKRMIKQNNKNRGPGSKVMNRKYKEELARRASKKVNEATLGGKAYKGKENPNNKYLKGPGVDKRAKKAYDKHQSAKDWAQAMYVRATTKPDDGKVMKSIKVELRKDRKHDIKRSEQGMAAAKKVGKVTEE